VDLIFNLPPPLTVKEICSFTGHARFYRRFMKDLRKIARPLCKLLVKETPFVFDEDYKIWGSKEKFDVHTHYSTTQLGCTF
jgi:hypothetical protein